MTAFMPLNNDPHVVALENALRADTENLRGYKGPINELLRERRMLMLKVDRVEQLEAKVERLSRQLEAAMSQAPV